jgi:hypothetical protein
VGLLVLNLVLAAFVPNSTMLGQALDHPVAAGNYIVLAWLVTSAATVGEPWGRVWRAKADSNEQR